jgi:hypothetical protein
MPHSSNDFNLFIQDNHVRILAGALLHPTYQRGDYHTIAETAAGIEYYLESRAGQNLTLLTPQESFKSGLQHMILATEGNLHDLLANMYPLILTQTLDVSVVFKPRIEDYLYIIKTRIDYSDKSQQEEFINSLGKILTEVVQPNYNIAAKIKLLSLLLHTVNESKVSHEKKYQGIFKKTEKTELYRFALENIKRTLLNELDKAPIGLLKKEDVLAAKKILGTYKTNGRHMLNTTSLSDPCFKKHELEQQKQDKIIAKTVVLNRNSPGMLS